MVRSGYFRREGNNKLLKADFHIHTQYSMDCDTTLEQLIARCQKMGINCIAVADHGSAEGALKLQKIAPFKVIVAEEILTPDGEIMGMFLKETIPTKIPVEEAIARIKAQGGLVSLPHPFDPLRGLKLDKAAVEKLAGQIDLVEVFNARGPFSGPVARAKALAQEHNLSGVAGSDSHYLFEIGYTYLEMPDFNSKEEFLAALKNATIHQQKASFVVYLRTAWARFIKHVLKIKKRKS
jgi:predicted metal-dependent phosphoesterase TrpH